MSVEAQYLTDDQFALVMTSIIAAAIALASASCASFAKAGILWGRRKWTNRSPTHASTARRREDNRTEEAAPLLQGEANGTYGTEYDRQSARTTQAGPSRDGQAIANGQVHAPNGTAHVSVTDRCYLVLRCII